MGELPEPWMRGPIEGVHHLLAPVLYSFQMAREDLEKFTAGLPAAAIWATPYGLTSVGFHLRHIAGSTDRLITYLQGRELTAAQLDALAAEGSPGESSREELLDAMDRGVPRCGSGDPCDRSGDSCRCADGGPQATADHRDRPAYAYRRTYAAACGTGDRRRKTGGGAAIIFPCRCVHSC